MSQFKNYLNKVRIDEGKKSKKEKTPEKNKKAIEFKDLLSGYTHIKVNGESLHSLLRKNNIDALKKGELEKVNIKQQVEEIIKKAKKIHFGTEKEAIEENKKIKEILMKLPDNNIELLDKSGKKINIDKIRFS